MQYQAWLWINSVAKLYVGYISTGWTHHVWHDFIEETYVISSPPYRESINQYTYSVFTQKYLYIFIWDARHVLLWRRTVSKVRCGIFPEIVVSMETVTQAEHSFLEIIEE